MPRPLLDTNVILRHLGQDHPDHSPRATAYIERIENGALAVQTTEFVVFETVFTLERTYKVPKDAIRAAVLPLIELPGIVLRGKRRFRRVFSVYVEQNVSFVDAYHAVIAREFRMGAIVSFDRGYDRIPGVQRIEP